MDDWVNWGDFIAANSDAGQTQADRDWQQRLDDEQFINSKMGELDAKAAGDTYATAMGGGQYQGHAASLGDYSAYQDLVARGNQRARQQMRRATAPAWETALVGPAADNGPSPWDSLSQRLGAQQQKLNQSAQKQAQGYRERYAAHQNYLAEDARKRQAELAKKPTAPRSGTAWVSEMNLYGNPGVDWVAEMNRYGERDRSRPNPVGGW